MKIVLNKCFGGFVLSPKAMMEILKRKGLTVYPYEAKISQDFTKTEWTRYRGHKLDGLPVMMYYFEKDPGKDQFVASYKDADKKYHMISVDFDDEQRADKDLVAVIEELGKEANGAFADLEVFEIPDGVEFEISDYDGAETAIYGLQIGEV